MIPIFENYPNLKETLPYVSLGQFPTPVINADDLSRQLDVGNIYIKNDGLSGQPYGGNKVRKLEFHFGLALKKGVKEVLTFGGAGSNHALATAIHAKKVGMKSISILNDQPNAIYVRQNLLKSYQADAELHLVSRKRLDLAAKWQCIRHKLKTGKFPYVIPMGGTCPLGTVGFVNAGLELKQQIDQNLLPEPDVIYVALGSMGTAIGLLLGITAAELNTKIIAVRVVNPSSANLQNAQKLFENTNALLHAADPTFKKFNFPTECFEIREDFFGPGYAVFTEPALQAVNLVNQTEHIKLEGTYTGKTFAAVIADSKAGRLKDKNVLFWNTHNAHNMTNICNEIDYHNLPEPFWKFFEQQVQPENSDISK